MKLNEKNIFLIDGVGAALSAFLTGVVLPYWADWVGLPIWILHTLGFIAMVFSVYSLSCYLVVKKIRPVMLLVIITANALYCILGVLVFFNFTELTILGHAFLIAEFLVILALVILEWQIYRKTFVLSTTGV